MRDDHEQETADDQRKDEQRADDGDDPHQARAHRRKAQQILDAADQDIQDKRDASPDQKRRQDRKQTHGNIPEQ